MSFEFFLSAFDDTLELCRSQRKIIFHPSFFLSFKKTLVAHEGEMQMNLMNKEPVDQILRV